MKSLRIGRGGTGSFTDAFRFAGVDPGTHRCGHVTPGDDRRPAPLRSIHGIPHFAGADRLRVGDADARATIAAAGPLPRAKNERGLP